MAISALEEEGLSGAWDEMQALTGWRRENGFFETRRAEQAEYWFGQEIRHGLLGQLEREPLKSVVNELARAVASGDVTPGHAAQDVLERLKSA